MTRALRQPGNAAAQVVAQEEGLRAVWLVPGEGRMTGYVIALEFRPECNDGKPFRLLWEGHDQSAREFFRLPGNAVLLCSFG